MINRTLQNAYWLILLALIPLSAMGENAWIKVKSSDAITVHTRAVDGSDIVEFRGVVQINSTLAGIIKLMKEVENSPQWIYNCLHARSLKVVSEYEQYNYYQSSVPVVQNRDMVMHLLMSQDTMTKTVQIDLRGAPDYINDVDGFVRVPTLKGFWRLRPLTPSSVEVTYQLHIDPGGWIPGFIIRHRVIAEAYETLKSLRKQVQSPTYRNSRLGYINEIE